MASKRSRKPPSVLKVSRRAQAEVVKLLKRDRAGTITRLKLQTGLKDVEKQLKQMSDFIFDFQNWS